MFKFVHAADLHLGAPFEGIREVCSEAADALRDATYEALNAIVHLALKEEVAFVLLAGDLCNRPDGNLRAELALRRAAQNLSDAGIRLFIVYGNHDYLDPSRPDLDWPPKVHVFPAHHPEPQTVTTKDGTEVFVFGRSYSRRDETENLAVSYPRPPSNVVSIGLLHAACGPPSGHAFYAPCTLDDLVQAGYDYWALGHVHAHTILRRETPTVVYPGNPQGLNPLETGPRGCCLVTVENGRVTSLDFRETANVRWFLETVDIAGMEREQDLITSLHGRLQALASTLQPTQKGLVRFKLVGRGPLHRRVSDSQKLDHLRLELLDHSGLLSVPVWTESVQSATQPDVDLEQRREAQDFLGDFLRLAQEWLEDPDRVAQLSTQTRKAVAPEHARTLKDLGLELTEISQDTWRQWLVEAVWMGTDHLLGAES